MTWRAWVCEHDNDYYGCFLCHPLPVLVATDDETDDEES